MTHYVPDFELDDNYYPVPIPSPSPALHKKFTMDRGEDEIMELLWQNGQVVLQSQRSSLKKSQPPDLQNHLIQTHQSPSHQIPHDHHHHQQHHQSMQPQPQPQPHLQNHNLFMQENEMAYWLHFPLDDTAFVSDLCSELMCIPSGANSTSTPTAVAPAAALDVRMPSVSRPPMPPPPPTRRIENFGHFARLNKPRDDEPGPSGSNRAANDSTVVDSSDTPAVMISRVSEGKNSEIPRSNVAADSSAGGGMRDAAQPCELTVTSSPEGSSASAGPPSPLEKTAAPQPTARTPEDRKRKAREGGGEEIEWQSEDVELESTDGKKQLRGSASTKRSRAAEVHNLSERRRRDRINEKMKALQELIPHCNKADKASMLDEAIEYLKSLQLQVQMMSMGCSMVPMMYPGVQQYIPNMGMGIGMGMGMEMGMNRPMMPFPAVLAGHQIPAAAAGANMGLRFPMPAFHMTRVPASDPSRVPPNIQSELMRNPLVVQNPGQPRIPNFADPYTQYLGMHHMQLLPQQQTVQVWPETNKPSNSKGAEDVEKHQPG